MEWRIIKSQTGQVELFIEQRSVGIFSSENDAMNHIRRLSGEEPIAVRIFNPN